MIKEFINNTFTVNIKGKSFEINKCRVSDLSKITDFSEKIKEYDTIKKIKTYFEYVSTYIVDQKKSKYFMKCVSLLDIDDELNKTMEIINIGLYGKNEGGDEKENQDNKGIIKSLLFVQKYYGLSTNDLRSLTLEQFGLYSEMIIAIENPEEYKKQEMNKKARSGDMTLDELKNFIFKK